MLSDLSFGLLMTPGSLTAPRCSLCAGTHPSGPRKGLPYPPCLACRDAVRRLAALVN